MSNMIYEGFSDGVYVLIGIYTTKKSAQNEKDAYKSIGRKAKIKTEITKDGKTGYVLWIKD